MKPGAGMVTEGAAIFFGFGFLKRRKRRKRRKRNEVKQGNGLLILLVTYLQLLTLHIKNNETTIWEWIEERERERVEEKLRKKGREEVRSGNEESDDSKKGSPFYGPSLFLRLFTLILFSLSLSLFYHFLFLPLPFFFIFSNYFLNS